MNIALLTTEYAHKKTPVFGGIGTFLTNLAKGLERNGHNVYVLVITGKKNFSFKDGNIVVKVRKNFFRKDKLTELVRSLTKNRPRYYQLYEKVYLKERKYIAAELKKYIKDKDIDIIETQDYGGISLFLGEETPVVIRCHGTHKVLTKEFGYDEYNQFSVIMNDIENTTISNKENHILGVSMYSSSLIRKYFERQEEVPYIYNGVDLEKFEPVRDKGYIKNSIFYFGTLSEKKGVKFLCEVFNEFKKNNPEATLHLIGRGENYFSYLEENVIDPKYIKDVTYYGAVENSKLSQYVKDANVVVFPTQGENFPFAFLEAMALEKVIIANDIAPAHEIISEGENGFIARTKQEFIEKIEEVFKNEELKKVIEKNARKTIKEKFTSDLMVENTENYYKKIIEKKESL